MTHAPAVVDLDGQPTPALCPACGHVLSAHDRIGLRWCGATASATSSVQSTRDCVCPDDARVVNDLTYHGGLTPNRK